jgi:DNA-binding transcriptional LysR family regulator
MALELQQLRQVIALAEHGSFVRAAAALHISQPALSRSIQAIERQFGSELFLRTSSGTVPTDLGRLYLERARDLLRMADDFEREAVHRGALQAGRVAVGGGPYPSEAVLARAAARFAEQFPGISLRVRSGDWDELLQRLRSRELDFFVAETSTLHHEADIEVAPLDATHALYFVARAGHPLALRSDLPVAELLSWPFITPGRVPPRILDPLLSMLRGAKGRSFPAIECNGLAPLKRILASSDAVSASILSCISRELEDGSLVLLGTAPWMHLHYGIVSLKGRPWTQAAGRFVEFVRDAERDTAQDEQRLARRFGTPGHA